MGNLYIGLLHYPVKNAQGRIVATALTGLDLHDIARSAKTFGVTRFYLITPLASQRRIARTMLAYWLESPAALENRAEALKTVEVVATLEASLDDLQVRESERPRLIATSARPLEVPLLGYDELRRVLDEARWPAYVIFGTGWGIADELLGRFDYALPPVVGPSSFNHLSVRAAAAIILDRLKGQREERCRTI